MERTRHSARPIHGTLKEGHQAWISRHQLGRQRRGIRVYRGNVSSTRQLQEAGREVVDGEPAEGRTRTQGDLRGSSRQVREYAGGRRRIPGPNLSATGRG